MSYTISVTFDTLADAAAWFRSQGQNVGNGTVTTNPVVTHTQTAQSNQASAEADPWTDEPTDTQSAPAASSAPSAGGPRTFTVNTDKGQQTWTLGAHNAPTCNCGIPAAFQEGSTNGRGWKRWTCSKSAPQDDRNAWKTKCKFNQFA